MTEDDSGGFEAELLSQLGGGVVADLVRVPAVGLLPGPQFGLLLPSQALLPLGIRLFIELGQRLWRQEGLVAGTLDRPAVAARRVAAACRPLRVLLDVAARDVAAGQGCRAALRQLLAAFFLGLARREAVALRVAEEERSEGLLATWSNEDLPVEAVVGSLVALGTVDPDPTLLLGFASSFVGQASPLAVNVARAHLADLAGAGGGE